MGLFQSVGRALGVTRVIVHRSELSVAGTSEAVIAPLIQAVSDLGPLETRRASNALYFEGVIAKSRLDEFSALLEGPLGPPAKPFGSRAAFEPALDALIQTRGGIDTGQCLYLRSFEGDGRVAFAALWPWSDGRSITLKVGIYA